MADKVKEDWDKGLIRILVYGTLKKGHANHRILEEAGATFMGYDSVTGPFRMCDMVGFPGVYRPTELPRKEMRLRGELWAMEPEGLAACDMLEGHPNFYRREKWWTDQGARAWMYIISHRFLAQAPTFTDTKDDLPAGIWHPSKDEEAFWASA